MPSISVRLLPVVISISSGSPLPVPRSRSSSSRQLRDRRECFFCACLFAMTQSRGPPHGFSLQAKDGASRSFSLVFLRLRNERGILDNDKFSFCASCASFCGSLPSYLLVALSRTLPFPTKLLVISVHSPFPVISLSSRATSTEISALLSLRNSLPRLLLGIVYRGSQHPPTNT